MNTEKRNKIIGYVIQALVAMLTAISGIFVGCQMK